MSKLKEEEEEEKEDEGGIRMTPRRFLLSTEIRGASKFSVLILRFLGQPKV